MAGKTKPMSQIKQALLLHQQGNSIKAIARSLHISKNTVRSYLHKIALAGWKINNILALEDPVLEMMFHAGDPAYSEDRFQYLKDKLDYYAEQFTKPHVTKELLWKEYRQEQPDGYGHSQFHYHLLQHLRAKNPSMVLEHQPADKLFIDFAGKTISYIDSKTGEIIPCQLFVACLPYSGYSFILAVGSQSLENFLYALSECLLFLGGVPLALVPDNLKSAIIKASRYEPDVNRAMEDFANHYGTVVIPTRVRKPQDKALVENRVHLTYTHVYARLRNQQFFSLTDLNTALHEKNQLLNQTRMQQKPYSREEKFIADEKTLLKPLPQEPFLLKYYRVYKVAQNNHIYLAEDRHYYSVPFAYIGQKVKVLYTRSLVHIYCRGKVVAMHSRNLTQGTYTTVKEHLCSHHQHYLDRSPHYYLERARSVSNTLFELFTLLFKQDRHPEQLYRTCDGLLNIAKKTTVHQFEKACALAIEYQNYSYKFILNIIQNNMCEHFISQSPKTLPVHENIRGKQYYQQLTLKLN